MRPFLWSAEGGLVFDTIIGDVPTESAYPRCTAASRFRCDRRGYSQNTYWAVASFPDISFVVVNGVFLKERPEFILKRLRAVVSS